MSNLRYGDRVEALPGSVSALFAEGRKGTIVSIRFPDDPYSQNLVRWDGDTIVMGFHSENLVKVEEP